MPAPLNDIIAKVLAAMPASWRTSSAGYGGLVVAGLMVAAAYRKGVDPDWEVVAGIVITSFGLLAARDNKVSSEQAGAK